jgi:predicted ATP-dependent endonuclease of OLD family
MDEPDAHIHEGYKKNIYNEIKTYAEDFGRQVVLTTHSPTLAYNTNENMILLDINPEGNTYRIR